MRKCSFLGTLALAAFIGGLAMYGAIRPAIADQGLGLGRVSNVVPLNGGGIAQVSTPTTSTEKWDVQEGKTYEVTLTNISDTGNGGTDATLEVIVKSSDNGNQCLTATNAGVGMYTFTVTMPANACNTYPILYGTTDCDPSTGLFARRSDGGDKQSHLRAWDFQTDTADTDCALPPQGCGIECPPDVEVCNDPGTCGATLTAEQIGTPTTDCPNPTVVGIRSDGLGLSDPFPVGVTTITWTATSSEGVEASCDQQITVKDCEPPQITCPADMVVQLHPGEDCPPAVAYAVTATDNCGTVDVQTSPPSGSTFPFGTTVVNATATDGAGNTASCNFTVTVFTSVCGYKFDDPNVNGSWDTDESPIVGWKVTLTGVDGNGNPVGPLTQFTDVDGHYCFDGLLPGQYVVPEVFPTNGTTWVATRPVSVPVNLTCPVEVNFGNVCLGGGGGLTLGFWSNKNGQALVGSDDLALLSSLNLRTALGADFNPATYSTFRTWILGANATNMAYMLSAQLAAMELNVLNGKVSGSSIVYSPVLGFATISNLMAAANASLGTDGYTPAGHPARTYQEALKNALDAANNNLNFVQPGPCPVVY